MKNLDWGIFEHKKILNTELLNKTNIRRFLSQSELDILNEAVIKYFQSAPSKEETKKFIIKTGKREDGLTYISVDIPYTVYIWEDEYVEYQKHVIRFEEEKPQRATIELNRIDQIKITTTENTAKISLGSKTLYIKQNEDGTCSYMKYGGISGLKVNRKDKAEMRKVKPSKEEIADIEQKSF